MEITKKANAKINLTLDIRGALPDGCHSIFTCMQSVGLCDTVTVKKTGCGIILECSDKSIPCDETNTAFIAAKQFFMTARMTRGCRIHIEKNIPVSAGLAGGSADAAAVLCALSELYNKPLSGKQLFRIACGVGADVPFCLSGGTCLCQNRGEMISVLPDFRAFFVIVKPDKSVSAKEAYACFDAAEGEIEHPDNPLFLYHAAAGRYKSALKFSSNVFEQLLSFPEGREIKRLLLANGAYFASMSGSGPSYFGLFGSAACAEKCAVVLREKYKNVFVCAAKKRGVE